MDQRNDDLAATLTGARESLPARPSASQQVADILRTQIVDGALRGGTRLTEGTISELIGYSRNTIREAFALLAAERVVERIPHRGVFVANPTPSDVRDLYATRRLIEPAALEYGTQVSADAITELGGIVSRAVRARDEGDSEAVAQANQLFHRTIAAMAGSRRVSELMEDVLAQMRLIFHAMAPDPQFHFDFLDGNATIVRLLESGERARAADELRDYLTTAEHRLLDPPA